MDIYIYSDESGVLDKVHNDYFVYAGLIFLSKEEKEVCVRRYRAAEKAIANHYQKNAELKGSFINNKDKGKLFRSLNNYLKFAVAIKQNKLLDSIFYDKKSKQRYLDFAFKICLKKVFLKLQRKNIIDFENVNNMHIYVDEHTTATNGRYELREALIQEFKTGTHNWNFNTYFPPIFPNLKELTVDYCNSEKTTLVRASDIIANRVYFSAMKKIDMSEIKNLYIIKLP